MSVQQTNGVTSGSCVVMVQLALINDNVPVVDLSGPQQSTVDYTTSVTYSEPSSRISIASSMARVYDMDSNSRIASVSITLSPGRTGDRLVIHNMCQVTEATTNCFVR